MLLAGAAAQELVMAARVVALRPPEMDIIIDAPVYKDDSVAAAEPGASTAIQAV